MNLLCYLLDSCCSELRTMILMACAQYMPIPLIANRPIKNDENFNKENLDDGDFGEEEHYEIL
jgi:hypothetical protein